MPIVWTDELKERVKGLWETNSASEIAAQLRADGYAVSRNSVVGMLHRAGITALNKTEDHPLANDRGRSTPRPPRPRPSRAKVIDLFAEARAREELFGSSQVHGIEALEPHHCRNPINDDMSAPIFCGRVVAAGKSWCPSCCARVYLPREERRAAA